jgi:hypothetical protein
LVHLVVDFRFASQKLHKPIGNAASQRKRGTSSVHKLLPDRQDLRPYSKASPQPQPTSYCTKRLLQNERAFNARLVSLISRCIASDISPIPRNSPQICERYCLIMQRSLIDETSTKRKSADPHCRVTQLNSKVWASSEIFLVQTFRQSGRHLSLWYFLFPLPCPLLHFLLRIILVLCLFGFLNRTRAHLICSIHFLMISFLSSVGRS